MLMVIGKILGIDLCEKVLILLIFLLCVFDDLVDVEFKEMFDVDLFDDVVLFDVLDKLCVNYVIDEVCVEI